MQNCKTASFAICARFSSLKWPLVARICSVTQPPLCKSTWSTHRSHDWIPTTPLSLTFGRRTYFRSIRCRIFSLIFTRVEFIRAEFSSSSSFTPRYSATSSILSVVSTPSRGGSPFIASIRPAIMSRRRPVRGETTRLDGGGGRAAHHHTHSHLPHDLSARLVEKSTRSYAPLSSHGGEMHE